MSWKVVSLRQCVVQTSLYPITQALSTTASTSFGRLRNLHSRHVNMYAHRTAFVGRIAHANAANSNAFRVSDLSCG